MKRRQALRTLGLRLRAALQTVGQDLRLALQEMLDDSYSRQVGADCVRMQDPMYARLAREAEMAPSTKLGFRRFGASKKLPAGDDAEFDPPKMQIMLRPADLED